MSCRALIEIGALGLGTPFWLSLQETSGILITPVADKGTEINCSSGIVKENRASLRILNLPATCKQNVVLEITRPFNNSDCKQTVDILRNTIYIIKSNRIQCVAGVSATHGNPNTSKANATPDARSSQ